MTPTGVYVVLPSMPTGYDSSTMSFAIRVYRADTGALISGQSWSAGQTPPWGTTFFIDGLQPGTTYFMRSVVTDRYFREAYSGSVEI